MSTRCAKVAAALVVCALARPALAEEPTDEAPLAPALLSPYASEPHYLRAAAELTLFLAAGALWYHLGDQYDELVRPPWHERFTREVVRLDNNGFAINFVGHPLSGAAYYGFSRANGLGMPASASYAFLASFLWEYVAELNEKISLNDLVTTPLAGIAIGEFFARLARYLNSAPGGGSRVQRAFGWTLGFSQAVHDAMDQRPPVPAGAERDALGYDAGIAHRFTYRAGAALSRGEGGAFPLAEGAVDGRLVALPGYLAPGRARRFFGDAEVTSMRLRASGGPEGYGLELDADTILLGLYARRVRVRGARLRGAAVVFGTSLGYHYRRDAFESFEDRLGTTRLPGLALDVDALLGRASLYVGARLQGEFAGIHSAAFDAWQSAHPDERTMTSLEDHDYYYGWGVSTALALRLELPYVALEGALAHARYDAQQGFDRNQEQITLDVEARDRVLDAEVSLRVPLARRLGFFAEVGAARRGRWSRVEEVERERRLERGYVRIGQVF